MKSVALGGLIGAGLVLLALCWQGPVRPAYADRLDPGMTDGLTAFSTPLPGGGQWVTIVNPTTQTMGVYHVAGDTGKITLKSVRRFYWDLQMVEFNIDGLRPGEIQRELEVVTKRP